METNEIPNPHYDKDQLSYPKSGNNSDGLGEVRSGEEF